MATGLSEQLTRQIGEHLVAAELGRRGIIATPFAGDVPDKDKWFQASIQASIEKQSVCLYRWVQNLERTNV